MGILAFIPARQAHGITAEIAKKLLLETAFVFMFAPFPEYNRFHRILLRFDALRQFMRICLMGPPAKRIVTLGIRTRPGHLKSCVEASEVSGVYCTAAMFC